MTVYSYSVRAVWRIEPTSIAEIGKRFLRTLDLIAEAAPEIGVWTIQSRPFEEDSMSMDEARRNITKLVEDNVAIVDEVPDPVYGYRLYARNRPDFSPKSIGLSATVGGRLGDRISFRLGDVGIPSDPEIVTYPLFRSALLSILAQ
jgi:hypothetical protein